MLAMKKERGGCIILLLKVKLLPLAVENVFIKHTSHLKPLHSLNVDMPRILKIQSNPFVCSCIICSFPWRLSHVL